MAGYPQPLAKVPLPALKTKIMETQDFKPQVGDLYIPDDMQQMFGGGKPVYQNKNMVLIGTMGSGKTTLYNKLTNSNEKTSNGAQTCTRKNASKKGLNIELQITDTPGLALDGGVSVDDSLEVRKALTVGDVTQIVVVQSLPNNGRVSALETSLAPIQKIMSCDTFRLDASGNDCWITKKERSPYRTRVFLVLTHRDNFQGPPRNEWQEYIESVREKFSWIGPVAMIDTEVTVEWLYKSIVACAGYTPLCNVAHHIPVLEFFAKFPMDFTLTTEQKGRLGRHKVNFDVGFNSAHNVVTEIRALRERGFSGSSGFMEKLGPTLDCLIRFLDDLFEHTTREALADLYGCKVDELWETTDEAENHAKVERWNAIKADFMQLYQDKKKRIQDLFPDQPGAGVYKKCPHCGEVYVKPFGCDFSTRCGNSAGAAADIMPFTYEYCPESRTFKVVEAAQKGTFEAYAMAARRAYRRMASRLTYFFSEDMEDMEKQTRKWIGQNTQSQRSGCGREIQWATMPCLTKQELVNFGLVPDSVQLDPNNMVLGLGKDIEAVQKWLKRHGLETYVEAFKSNAIDVDMLMDLTEDDLRGTEFGMTNALHIKKILKKRHELKPLLQPE